MHLDLLKIKIMKKILLLLPILLLIGCNNKEQMISDISIHSDAVLCCNIWEDFKTIDNSHADAVSVFLTANNINFIDLSETNVGTNIDCDNCCLCPSGIEINFKINEADLEEMLAFGFVEN